MKTNKHICITGGSSGIGFFMVNFFLNLNYKVTCISRSEPKIVSKNLKTIKCDLSNLDLIKNKLGKLKNKKIDALINNAGDLGEIGPLSKVNFFKWKKSFDLNLFSHILVTKLLQKNLKKNKSVVIFVSGGGSAAAFPNFSAYSLAKTSLVRLVENLHFENKSHKYYIIAPGPNNTKILKKSLEFGHKINKKKIVTPDLAANLCLFLLKNRPQNLNGKFIHVKDNYKKLKKTNKNFLTLRRVETI